MSFEKKLKENSVSAFGFSFKSEEELKEPENRLLEDKNRELERLKKVMEMVMSLLSSLKNQPEKTYVYWPNRTEEINRLLAEINDVGQSD